MLMAFHDDILMNFIGDNIDMMLLTYIQHPLYLPGPPYPSHRIMRGAQYKQLYVMFHDFLFKILIVHHISIFRTYKGTFHKLSVIIKDCVAEWIIHRRHNNNSLLFPGQYMHQPVDGRNNSGSKTHPLSFHLIIVICFLPPDKCICVCMRRIIISEHAEISVFLYSVLHTFRNLKIHISHPQRKQLLIAEFLPAVIPLHGVCILSFLINYLIHSDPLLHYRIIVCDIHSI